MTTMQTADPSIRSIRTDALDRAPGFTGTRRLLVAWFRFSVHGGISRFVHMARVLKGLGHQVEFVSLSGETEPEWPGFPGRLLTLEEAESDTWDAVMIPGAGAPAETLRQLEALRQPCFGRRIQHILSDTSILDGFNLVNAVVDPDLVIINNTQWRPRDYRHLGARGFHLLPGAVDTELFYPLPLQSSPADSRRWSIGAYAGRSLEPVLDTVDLLPADCVVHLFGGVSPEHADRVHTLVRAGRVEVHGALFDHELADFYRSMDLVIAAQDRAGWCNPAAEAMACGVPCVVGDRGTVDFAQHRHNALVVDPLDAELIAGAVARLRDDRELRVELARSAAASMREWSWHRYCGRFLEILALPLAHSYYRIPELGLYGKWEPETRITGLEALVGQADGATLLDLGAAEGIVGWLFARNGARLVHGFELDADRVAFANDVLAPSAGATCEFRQGDLTDWSGFVAREQDLILDAYDVVLFLGIYHHLPASTRRLVLSGAAERSRRWLAIRTGEELIRADGVVELLASKGFSLIEQTDGDGGEQLGWLGIFERTGRIG